MTSPRRWLAGAVETLAAEARRSADTHLLRLDLPGFPGISLYLKDESVHPTGSLKHRLARSLFLYGLCNGWIREGRCLVEASSGNTAVSEAYFARLLGLELVAVVPVGTSPEKLALIESFGGSCDFVAGTDIYAEAERVAAQRQGHYLDQFTYAERATDWRGNNNIAESIFEQMALEAHPHPRWIVVPAGTGGTSATIGRYVRYIGAPTQVCVVDPENSVFFDAYAGGDLALQSSHCSRIEGIGRPRVEPSFLPEVVDRMLRVPDAATVAALPLLERWLGRRCGGSTGTGVVGALRLMCRMRESDENGAVVTLIGDGGERYAGTCYDPAWIAAQGLDPGPWSSTLEAVAAGARWPAGQELPTAARGSPHPAPADRSRAERGRPVRGAALAGEAGRR
ncbi:MAG TPA: PLP-dependent cysteine synthase family protein [Xanthomonadaceae bacterium]|nr:PLP-dependent cysteine synthase family protein [Xanthomonadaceae bacterium]